MPYCTIEEAWSLSLNPELKNYKTSDDKYGYYDIDLSGPNPYVKKERSKKTNRSKKYSRDYNKLDEHNGPMSRHKKIDERFYVNGYNNVKKDIESESSNSSQQNKISKSNISGSEVKSDTYSLMEDFRDNYPIKVDNSENQRMIDELKNENKKLRALINDLKNSKVEDKDNLFDLIVFISTGILIIFMMENITKLFRKF